MNRFLVHKTLTSSEKSYKQQQVKALLRYSMEGTTECFAVVQETFQPIWKMFWSEDLLQVHNQNDPEMDLSSKRQKVPGKHKTHRHTRAAKQHRRNQHKFEMGLYYVRIHLKTISYYTCTCEHNMMQRWNFHQSTSLAESHKIIEAHNCKSRVTNSSIVSHTLGILTSNITYCIILLEYISESHHA